ncbi:MAG: sensor histidine kinase [Bacteroidaceae bacterium]|nr:sensor histidine kinase [Bacteroidaceae bacterium]
MKKKVFILFLSLLSCPVLFVGAQEAVMSNLQQRAETENKQGNIANARSLFIRAYEDYVNHGNIQQGVTCGVKATALYYRENLYKEAFELLRRIDQSIVATGGKDKALVAALRYQTTKERMQMYMKMRKSTNVMEQLNVMESLAVNDSLRNDFLYNKTIYYYSFGQNEQGNATFKEMADKLTSQKEYDKVDEVYQTLIANGRRAGSANLVAQSYKSYIVWKDSVNALKVADETCALKQQIADNEATIAEMESSLTSRKHIIGGLCVLVAVLAAILIVGALVLMRYIFLIRRQKKTIKMANENNVLKARFINNISAQLNPTLQKLDSSNPEVKALTDFSQHIQMLSTLECTMEEPVEMDETQMDTFCESLMNQIRSKVKNGVTLSVDAPGMSVPINKEYVSHILLHLLNNAAEYTPEGGFISLDFKKRGVHKNQFHISNTGSFISEERREDVFKPFLEIKDLTEGDGLGLAICKQMAVKMHGDLTIDAGFTKGTRFVLDLHG